MPGYTPNMLRVYKFQKPFRKLDLIASRYSERPAAQMQEKIPCVRMCQISGHESYLAIIQEMKSCYMKW